MSIVARKDKQNKPRYIVRINTRDPESGKRTWQMTPGSDDVNSGVNQRSGVDRRYNSGIVTWLRASAVSVSI